MHKPIKNTIFADNYSIHDMNFKILISLAAILFLAVSCGQQTNKKDSKHGFSNEELLLEGDKTVYGLACEGCSDSVIILLPNDGSDPVRYDIIDATQNHKVMGKPKVGDWLGLVLNEQDSTMADLVINLDELKGTWCYVVMPQMRDYDKMSEKLQRRIMRDMPDSIKNTYLIPREYGFTLKRQWTAQSVGYVRESSLEESPVVYPKLGYFTEWHIWNGKLIMTSGDPVFSKGSSRPTIKNQRLDTCDIDYLGNDSLVLSSDGMSRSYYRNSDVRNINKKAKAIANKQAQKALESIKN